jgi:hypothetical protein
MQGSFLLPMNGFCFRGSDFGLCRFEGVIRQYYDFVCFVSHNTAWQMN